MDKAITVAVAVVLTLAVTVAVKKFVPSVGKYL